MEIRNNSTMRHEIKKLITKKKEKDMLSSYLIEEEHERVISLDVKETESFLKQCEKRLPHFQNPGALVTKAAIACGNLEANPLMNPVLRGFLPTLLVKGVLPLALSVLCAVLFKLSGLEEIRFGNILLDIGIVVYAAVNLWHIVNFLLLFSAI